MAHDEIAFEFGEKKSRSNFEPLPANYQTSLGLFSARRLFLEH